MKKLTHSLINRGLARVLPGVPASIAEEADRMQAPSPVLVSGQPVTAVVLASPHSGRFYPEAFVQESRQPLTILRSGEDSYVEDLAASAHALGPILVHATFPRVFCDVNRAAWDLDPRMFETPAPPFVRATHRGLSGLGSVPRIVADNRQIYRTRMPFMEAALRIRDYWMPYHVALANALNQTLARHNITLLLDLHSMPDVPEAGNPDFVLGDAHGASCASTLVQTAEESLQSMGFKTSRNIPYAGGYITQHYGRPREGLHALQIEMRRGLYMHEKTRDKHSGFFDLQHAISQMTEKLIAHMHSCEMTG
ncbi:N-formylglutamate amidohydrolase [Acetobacter orleanensis]|uniref:N-formylglutamate amidohydrolase n=1 Tax=Acetobacter orleanensis TaxID=104099 RepID=A0A4Y3TT94_9PROT|nr:N-formylglutamate amidohydrolase [Acetobacter orleanensis]KXV66909.1 N-formylglutamate amidohydrolase [Acetobacter orleanensis]PCD78373.1 N-formylglutamate amidohydrolase [Acetobacter orleanensis]GAN69360.1 N-formylglutamate amidohydrolase [Acetobacter orleanensis JCM 7639]GEB83995.1 N-formylglutamate amidohydrolase [Acetobacter orleanensis]